MIKPNCFGCLPTSERSQKIVAAGLAAAKPVEYLWENKGDMPVLDWESFNQRLDFWIGEADELRAHGVCTLPWVVLISIPESRKISGELFFSQGPINSCAAHGEAFAYERSLLRNIAYGAPLAYRPVNPYVNYWLSSPGDRGGRGIAQIAQFANKNGHWGIDAVGSDNTRMPSNYKEFAEDALTAQTAFAYIGGSGDELIRNVIRCLRADFGVFWGNTTAIRSSKIENGVKVASLGGRWAHATSGVGYRKIGSTEFVCVANSHGGIYSGSSEGEPEDVVWMDSETFADYGASFATYDRPCVIVAEGLFAETDWSLRNGFKLDFPSGFKL